MKKCPYCTEEIQETAVKCKFCGEFLNNSKATTLLSRETFHNTINEYASNLINQADVVARTRPTELWQKWEWVVAAFLLLWGLSNLSAKHSLIVLIILFLPFVFLRSQVAKKKIKTAKNHYLEMAQRLGSITLESGIATGLTLHNNELALLQTEANLSEVVRGYQTKGLSVGYGRNALGGAAGGMLTSSESMPKDTIKQIDAGQLVITNERLIYQGAAYTRCASIDEIISLSAFQDGFAVHTTKNDKAQFYGSDDGPLFVAVIKSLKEAMKTPEADKENK